MDNSTHNEKHSIMFPPNSPRKFTLEMTHPLKKLCTLIAIATSLTGAQAQLFWNDNGVSNTLTSANWNTSGTTPYTTPWTNGSNIVFTATSAITYVTVTAVGNISVTGSSAVDWTGAGTFSTGGAVRTVDIGTGSTLTWNGQSVSTAAGTGFIKNGAGTWDMGAGGAYTGGFTLNAGTLLATGNSTFGAAGSLLTINGGTIQNTGGITFAPTTITVGGDFALAGSGSSAFSGAVALGATTRTITNDSTGIRNFGGIISGSAGTGLTLAGSGTTVFSAANSYTGTTTINSGVLRIGSGGAAGSIASTQVTGSTGATLAFNRSDALTFTSTLSGGIGLRLMSGTTTFNTVNAGTSTFTGLTTIDSGATMIIGGNQFAASGVPGAASTIVNNGNLTIFRIGTTTQGLDFSTAAITGIGSLTLNQASSNLTILNAANTYSGGTTLNGGAIRIGVDSVGTVGNITSSAIGTGTLTLINQSTSPGSVSSSGTMARTILNSIVIGGTATLGSTTPSLNGALTFSGLVNLSGATRAITVNSAVQFDGVVSNGGLTLGGTSVLTLTGSNTYSDGTNLNGGTLTLGSLGALGTSGTISFGGGALRFTSSNTTDYSSRFSTAASQAYRIDTNGQTVTLASSLASSGGTLNKSGAGILILSGSNTYTGLTNVSSGTLQLGNADAVRNTTLQHNTIAFSSGIGTFNVGGWSALSGSSTALTDLAGAAVTLNIGGNNTSTSFNSIFSGSGAINKVGTGTLTFGQANTYTGTTTISAGTLVVSSFGSTASASIVNNSVLVYDRSGGAATVSAVISGSGSVLKTGSSGLGLSGSSTYSGGTTLREGSLTITNNGLGATTGSLTVSNTNTGTATAVALTLATDRDTTVGSLNGTMATAASGTNTATITGTTGRVFTVNQTTSGTYAGSIAGGGSFVLGNLSTNRLVLTGSNSYTAGTTVNAGTLLVSNATGSSGLGTGNVVVNGGKIGGSGAFTGALAVNTSGTLSPGSSIETLGSGTLTFNNGSTFEYEVDSFVSTSVGADLQKVTGGLNLNGTVTLTLADLASLPVAFAQTTTIFTLINYSGAWNNGLFTFGGNAIADEGRFTAGLNIWQLDYNATTGGLNFSGEYAGGNFVNITAVPEPSTWALLGLGLMTTMFFRRRRTH